MEWQATHQEKIFLIHFIFSHQGSTIYMEIKTMSYHVTHNEISTI